MITFGMRKNASANTRTHTPHTRRVRAHIPNKFGNQQIQLKVACKSEHNVVGSNTMSARIAGSKKELTRKQVRSQVPVLPADSNNSAARYSSTPVRYTLASMPSRMANRG